MEKKEQVKTFLKKKKSKNESLRLISKGKEFSGIKKWSTVCKKQSTI